MSSDKDNELVGFASYGCTIINNSVLSLTCRAFVAARSSANDVTEISLACAEHERVGHERVQREPPAPHARVTLILLMSIEIV